MTETRKCIERSKKLVTEITEKVRKPDVSIIANMDQLSDELCRVADLAECIRQVHPDPSYAMAAQEACLTINTFVEELNTDPGLYAALWKFMDTEEFLKLDQVTRRTADVFMHDFKISGIHLEESLRKKAVRLNQHLLELGYIYSQSASEPTFVKKDECFSGWNEYFAEGSNSLVCVDYVPYESSDSHVRQGGYLSYFAQDGERLRVFEELMWGRQKLAQLVGFPSFASRVLKMSMAEGPAVVMEFLDRLSSKILPLARQDVVVMTDLLHSDGSDSSALTLRPWDVPTVLQKARRSYLPVRSQLIQNWFSLDTCLNGLNQLFKMLFDIQMESISPQKGEVWHPSVYKFGFVDKDGQILGYVYGDFCHRENKLASDCHFTIRGGREVVEGEGERARVSYQLPVITLCCSFEQKQSKFGQRLTILLSQHSVETLFHEMGHALHSILGRTKYQNVTGTRCSTDFAEVPSILMEFFFNDDRVISSFARHYETGEEMDESLSRTFQLSGKFFAAYDMQNQIANAILDQKFHSDVTFSKPSGWSTELYRETFEKYMPLGHIPGTATYLRFPHLCSYGGRYYAYLWSRAVASLIWKSNFAKDPFSRANGDDYRVMLSQGGGINPRELVGNMLSFEPTVEQLVDSLYHDILKQRERVQILCKD